MSWTLKLDPISHDLKISGGRFTTTYGAEEVRQRVKIALYHYFGEYFLNVNKGVPWHTGILGAKNGRNVLSNIIRKKILEVPGVIRIMDFSLTYSVSTRSYSLRTTIMTTKNSSDLTDYLTVDGIYVEA
ncbi:MAG: hypothetical protein PHU12_04740 [Candidatus Aenigmarchaeota archaeon]|nr:hypothetical protein [Candidatus Aenigmarchaeota archaeon]